MGRENSEERQSLMKGRLSDSEKGLYGRAFQRDG
jgi:hypothetical protein